MKKCIVVLSSLFLVNLMACNPTNDNASLAQKTQPYTCLSSQNTCHIQTEQGDIELTFSGATEQGKLKTELPFTLKLVFKTSKSSDINVKVQSYLEGKSMFMGKVPIFFNASTEGNSWQAESLLASCSDDVMTWRLWLTLEIKEEDKVSQQTVFFDFDSKR